MGRFKPVASIMSMRYAHNYSSKSPLVVWLDIGCSKESPDRANTIKGRVYSPVPCSQSCAGFFSRRSQPATSCQIHQSQLPCQQLFRKAYHQYVVSECSWRINVWSWLATSPKPLSLVHLYMETLIQIHPKLQLQLLYGSSCHQLCVRLGSWWFKIMSWVLFSGLLPNVSSKCGAK